MTVSISYTPKNWHGTDTAPNAPEEVRLKTAVQTALTSVEDKVSRWGITASEQMAPADTTVETANTQKITIPANTITAGARLVGRALAKVGLANSTDTLTA